MKLESQLAPNANPCHCITVRALEVVTQIGNTNSRRISDESMVVEERGSTTPEAEKMEYFYKSFVAGGKNSLIDY